MNNVLIGGEGWVYYETIGGGQGARPWADGMSGVHTTMTNTLDTPVEALERALRCAFAATPCAGGAVVPVSTAAATVSNARSRCWRRSPSR